VYGQPVVASIDPQFVAALSHGLEILRCFTAADPVLTNGELARLTGMPRSSVSRLTHTLVKVGYLDYDANARAYRLGPAVLSLQPAALAGTRIAQDIAPHMTELADRLGVRVLLTVYDRYGLTVLQGVCTNPDIPAPSDVGARYGIPRRAMGRAYIASCPASEQEAIVDHLARDDSERVAALRRERDQAVSSYRSRGYCTSLGEGRPGNHSISVSLNLPHLGRRLLLSCGGPAEHLTEAVLHERAAPLLMQSALDIERTSARLAAAGRRHLL
jgi:DNA-binding IclR family transcriptional regulator